MLRKRAFMLFLVALIFGIGAAWMANNWMKNRMASTTAGPDMKPVVIAAMDIPFGQKIELVHLRTINWPSGSLPNGVLHDMAVAEGRVANQKILAGEPVLNSRVVEQIEGSTLSALITPTKRAVTVRVNDVIGVAGFLLPGNRVDVIATRKINNSRAAQTRTILQDLKVLAVDQLASPEKDKPVVVRAVTLEMDPDQAEKMVKATEEGSVQLALRNPTDKLVMEERKEPEAVVKRRTGKAKPRSDVGTVTVIRGTTVDVSNVRM